jgi:hypothetical protein
MGTGPEAWCVTHAWEDIVMMKIEFAKTASLFVGATVLVQMMVSLLEISARIH